MIRKDDLQNGYFLWQDPELFCFGVDAVLLAHFPELRNGDQVADFGCGVGPLPLLMQGAAVREGRRGVTFSGIEIQERAAELAKRSAEENGLSDVIRIFCGDLREAERILGRESMTLVVCNPPYQRIGSGFLPQNEAEAIARTELCCTLSDVVLAAGKVLKMRGRLAMIHRPERLQELMGLLSEYGFCARRLRFVHPHADDPPTMMLVEAVKGGRAQLHTEAPLVLYEADGRYTEEVYRIYGMKP